MKRFPVSGFAIGLCEILALAFLMVPKPARAQGAVTWNAIVGAESHDEAKQADAFLPNELWIYAGDSVKWTFAPENEPHTVSFLAVAQPRPLPPPPIGPPFGGCPPSPGGVQPSGSTYDGSSCVTSGAMMDGQTYSVKFSKPGNFKFVCLIHTDMGGVVHVLSTDPASPFFSATLPYLEADYDKQAADQRRDLIDDSDTPNEERSDFARSQNEVLMTGEVAATGGGKRQLSIVRFFPGTIHVHVGDTVEWTNTDPSEPHTVTFGTEPANPMSLVNVTLEADGAWHGEVGSASDSVSSGFLQAAPQDQIGSVQTIGKTRISITFTHAGTFDYKCALHDVDGMLGTVVVQK
jgi:plastocyanin